VPTIFPFTKYLKKKKKEDEILYHEGSIDLDQELD